MGAGHQSLWALRRAPDPVRVNGTIGNNPRFGRSYKETATVYARFRKGLTPLIVTLFAACLSAQNQPTPDVLTFTNGEKLIGELKSATDTKVTFKSDMAGEVTVEWSKVQELRSSKPFAAIPKDVVFKSSEDAAKVVQGTLEMRNQTLELATGAAPRSIPVGQVSNVVSEPAFQRALHHRRWREGWLGAATAGLAIARSTQNLQTITSTIDLSRTDPGESWLRPRSRTHFDFNSAYGKISQSGSPTLKTSLYHSDLERDYYFSKRFYALGSGSWDHNFAQGLDLQQAYGGGIGYTVFKTERSELQSMATVRYVNQKFSVGPSQQLIASNFQENFTHAFANKITFNEQATISPAWNNTNAYSAGYLAALTVPVFHRFGLSVASFDNYINDPPPGFKKNSIQFTIGASYAFK